MLNGQFDNSRKIRHVELLHHAAAIRVHRLRGKMQHNPDPGTGMAVGDQFEDFALTLAETAQGADWAWVPPPLGDDFGDSRAQIAPAGLYGPYRFDHFPAR